MIRKQISASDREQILALRAVTREEVKHFRKITGAADREQIRRIRAAEQERAVYENSRRNCLDLARNSSMSAKEIHANLTEHYGQDVMSLGTVRRLCSAVR